MSNFALLDQKKKAVELAPNDHVMVEDMLWRVVNNFRVVGGGSRMLMLAYHTHVNEPISCKFHEVRSEERFEVFQPIE